MRLNRKKFDKIGKMFVGPAFHGADGQRWGKRWLRKVVLDYSTISGIIFGPN